jgi:hypothetical protein
VGLLHLDMLGCCQQDCSPSQPSCLLLLLLLVVVVVPQLGQDPSQGWHRLDQSYWLGWGTLLVGCRPCCRLWRGCCWL